MVNIREINIKKYTDYFYNYRINIIDFDPNQFKKTGTITKILIFITLSMLPLKNLII